MEKLSLENKGKVDEKTDGNQQLLSLMSKDFKLDLKDIHVNHLELMQSIISNYKTNKTIINKYNYDK